MDKQKKCLSLDKKEIPHVLEEQIGDDALNNLIKKLKENSNIDRCVGYRIKFLNDANETEGREDITIKEADFIFSKGDLKISKIGCEPVMISQYSYNTLWSSPSENLLGKEQPNTNLAYASGANDAFKEKVTEAAKQTKPQQQPQPPLVDDLPNEKPTEKTPQKDSDDDIQQKIIKKQKEYERIEELMRNNNFYTLYLCLYKINVPEKETLKKSIHEDTIKQSTENKQKIFGESDDKISLRYYIKPIDKDDVKNMLPQSLNEEVVKIQAQTRMNFNTVEKIVSRIVEELNQKTEKYFGFFVYVDGNPETESTKRNYRVYGDEQFWIIPNLEKNCFTIEIDKVKYRKYNNNPNYDAINYNRMDDSFKFIMKKIGIND